MNEQGKILSIGTIEFVEGSPRLGNGWAFDCRGDIPALKFNPGGAVLIAGYSMEQLAEIASRPDEFLVNES